MTQLYLITGFLGAGKTTFIEKFVKLFPDLALFCFPSDYMNSKQPVSDADAETQLLSIFRGLPHDKQLECLVMVAANFGDKLKENEK